MNIRPAGYYEFSDDEEEGSEYESGFSEDSADSPDAIPSPAARLQMAIQHGALDEVAQLMDELPDYESVILDNGLKPLVYAASLGNAQIVDLLLRQDAERGVVADAYASYTPLMAVCSGFVDDRVDDHEVRLECVKLLLEAGHEAGFRDRYGETALMRACKMAPTAIVETLLQVGNAKLNEADNEGWSPLFYATNRGDLQLVEYLLKMGADSTKPDKRNRYPFMIAMEKGFSELVDLLTPESERPTDEFTMLSTRPSVFDEEEDTRYCTEVVEMVLSTSATSKRNAAVFADGRMSLREFLLLKSEQELKTLGILFSGHRKKILARVKQFHLGCWLPESFGLAEIDGCGHLLMMLNFVATLHRQLYVLQTSLEYVKSDVGKLGPEEQAAAAQMLRSSKDELLRLNQRLATLKRQLAVINAESRPYLTAEEVVD